MKSLLISIILFSSLLVKSQDSITVYFDFGKSNLSKYEKEKIDEIPIKFNLSEVDEIRLEGFTDSKGSALANMELSKNRILTVEKLLRKYLDQSIIVKLYPYGEIESSNSSKARRVNITLFYKEITQNYALINTKENEIAEEINPSMATEIETDTLREMKNEETPNPVGCYNIAYGILHKSIVKEYTKNGEKYILIETEKFSNPRQKYYYDHFNEKLNKYERKKVRWSRKRTGRKWWERTRVYANIPVKDFKNRKIYTITEYPCDNSCSITEQLKLKEEDCLRVDSFLMVNSKYKPKLGLGYIKVKTPIDYIDERITYYSGCYRPQKINWQRGVLGKRKNYYFTSLKVLGNKQLELITREMKCCENEIISCFKGMKILVEVPYYTEFKRALDFNIFSRYSYPFSRNEIYSGLSLTYYFRNSYFDLNTSYSFSNRLESNFEYDKLVYKFQIPGISYNGKWQLLSTPKVITNFASIIIGSKITSHYQIREMNTFSFGIHSGIGFYKTNPKLFSRVSFRAGVRNNFNGEGINPNFYFDATSHFKLFRL